MVLNIYNTISQTIHSGSLSIENLILITGNIMTMVEQIPNLSGPEKKDLVLSVLNQLIADVPDPQIRVELQLADKILPYVIDIVVAASKGQLGLNIQQAVQTVKSGCFNFCKKV